jgi:phosphate transport system substrate-binding protein
MIDRPRAGAFVLAAVAVGCLIAAAACSNHQPGATATSSPAAGGALTLVGAGSTFVYPFFSRAFDAYRAEAPGVTINYQSIGSGGGISQFSAQTVDFGATDVPMGGNDLASVPGGARSVLQIPVALGGIAVVYNVPGTSARIALPPGTLAAIFSGGVSRWNDAAIAKANPGVSFPDLPIVVVHRADSSGTTYIFTDYLSVVSPSWRSRVGTAKSVTWPAASSIGMKGNEGVAGQVKNTPGAIGYVELAYALETKMSYAALVNASGALVVPSIASVRAAAAAEPEVSATKYSIVNAPGKASYPLAGYTWALLYRHYDDRAKQAALCRLFRWLESDGQRLAPSIDYVDLPPSVSARAVSALGACG